MRAVDAHRRLAHGRAEIGPARVVELLVERRLDASDRRDGARLGHPPGLHDGQARLLAVGLRQCPRHRRAAARDGAEVRRVSSLQLREHAHPDGGHARGDRHPLRLDEVGERRRRKVGSRHHEGRAGGDARMSETPGVGVEHRHDRQDAVGLTRAQASRGHRSQRVQERRAMRVDDTLGVARGAARVAHRRGEGLVVDVELDGRPPPS